MADVTETVVTGIGGSFRVMDLGQGPRLVCTECAAQVDASGVSQKGLVLYADIHDCDAQLWALPWRAALAAGKAPVPRQSRGGLGRSRWGRRLAVLPASG